MTIPENTAIIGKIPGYNANIDSTHEFEQELLKGVTFVDLRPMTYQLGTVLGGSTDAGIIDNVMRFFDGVFNDLVKAQKMNGLFKKDSTISKEVFHRILTRMKFDFNLSEDFADKDMIRIVCANDSTFTEQFSNSFGGENGISTMVNAAKNKWNDSSMGFLQKGLKSYSHADMIDLAGSMSSLTEGVAGANAADIATGIAFGMNIATPTTWDSSQYTSTLSVFLKLVAPIGTEECVQRNIVEPMMYLLAASSPLTYSGLMYGFPLLWDVQAHGITNFRIGAIAAVSFIRGSFETTFNTNLQPTVIDVRLTIVPLLNDFAVQPDAKAGQEFTDSIYDNPDSLGVQNPLDVWTGTMNRHPNAGGEVVSILTIKL